MQVVLGFEYLLNRSHENNPQSLEDRVIFGAHGS